MGARSHHDLGVSLELPQRKWQTSFDDHSDRVWRTASMTNVFERFESIVQSAVRAAPIVFDKASGYFWKGRKFPQDVPDPRSLKNVVQIGQIHALQLLAEYVRGSKSSYYSYELNLVLEDGKRLNVVDHGNQTKLREDAKTLSQFLGKPVWDAI